MKHETQVQPDDAEGIAQADRTGPTGSVSSDTRRRGDPRYRLAVQAFVAIPSLNSRAYQVREISRGGMFLGFKEPTSTWLEFEQNNIEPGTHVEIAFAFTLSNVRHRFSVSARISRITRQGIGVQFATHNPPQLAALRELFAQNGERSVPTGPEQRNARPSESRQTLPSPPDTGKWQEWELID